MGRALYRKYRPNSLDGVVGQGHVTDILSRSLKQGRIAHAYLLTGPKGVGKTSIARILAHEINQLPYSDESTHLDIIEIDAASNNGVEDIRDLREKVRLAPISAPKKVYIIDEVHMLSKPAFNALLKTLEEPPEHVVFILATTDLDKLPATIISRTQRFGFRLISRDDAVSHLKMIAEKEKIRIDDDALAIIAERGDGSFRDSISLLDQLSSLADEKTGITPGLVESTLGLAPRDAVTSLLAAVKAHDTEAIVKQLNEFDRSGVQATVLTSQLIATVRQSIAEHPQLISLLDDLLEVGRSSHPNIKLLTVLINHAAAKPKTAALSAPVPSISASVEELRKKPVLSHPNGEATSGKREQETNAPFTDSGSGSDIASSNGTESEERPTDSPTSRLEESLARNSALDERGPEVEQNSDTPIQRSSANDDSQQFDWQKLIDHVKSNHVALYSVLSKCTHTQDGDKLVLYTHTAFYKKKLDDPKYRPQLADSLQKIGVGEIVIETIASPPPPKDSKAAAVAAIMGGGEEINL